VRHLHVAELRDSWSAWLGVCLAFVVTSFALGLSSLTLLAAVRFIRSGRVEVMESAAYAVSPVLNLSFCLVIGAIVIGYATSLVVDSRRGSLARLALTGATPGQVVSTIMVQLAVVSLACSLVGDVLAFTALAPALELMSTDRGIPPPPPVYEVWPVLVASLLAVGLALLGGFRQAHRASRIPPVEALRQSGSGVRRDGMTWWRWLGFGLCLILVAVAYAALTVLPTELGDDVIGNLVQGGMVLLVVAAALLAFVAPAVVGPLTRAWTSLIPSFDPSWDLTRSTTVAKATRLTKSVVPVMMTVGLTFGMLAVGESFQSSLRANGIDVELTGGGLASTLEFLGLPLAIALSGGVGSLVMMAKQRDAELALSGIVGTTPAQRLAMPVMEGVIIAVTGALLAVVMVAVSVGFMAVGFPAAGYEFGFSPPYAAFALAFLVATAITVSATLLPTLRSLRMPEPRVIARLVAE
jgi:putative ABC transport system permease protein